MKKMCVCGHSEKDHSRFVCDVWEEKLNNVGISEEVACDCYNFNPARAEDETPNENGVYPKDAAERILFAVGKAAHQRGEAVCEVYVLQIGAEWLMSTDCSFYLGNYHGSSGPLSRDREPYLSQDAALLAGLDRCLRHFHTCDRTGESCGTVKQTEVSIAMHNKLQAFKASIGGAAVVEALPVGTQFSLFN